MALEAFGQARPRQAGKYGQAIALQPGVLAAPERRGRGERQKVRQVVGHLVHQVDAQIVVLDRDVDVESTDQKAPCQALEVAGQLVVALAVGVLLRVPMGKRMGRGGDRREPVACRDVRQRLAQAREFCAGRRGGRTGPRPCLDLRPEELGAHLPGEQCLALGHHGRRRVGRDVAAGALHQ